MLAIQLEEKKRKEEMNKNYNMRYDNQVYSNAEKFKSEISEIEKNRKEKVNQYKQQLDRQLQEKTMKKQAFMDETEKGINRELINEIKYKY